MYKVHQNVVSCHNGLETISRIRKMPLNSSRRGLLSMPPNCRPLWSVQTSGWLLWTWDVGLDETLVQCSWTFLLLLLCPKSIMAHKIHMRNPTSLNHMSSDSECTLLSTNNVPDSTIATVKVKKANIFSGNKRPFCWRSSTVDSKLRKYFSF